MQTPSGITWSPSPSGRAVYASSPEQALTLALAGQGQLVTIGPASHTGQTGDSGWSAEAVLIWGLLGFLVGGALGAVAGWQACKALGRVMPMLA